MDWILYAISIFVMFATFCLGYMAKSKEEPANRVHFYVARDINGDLWLYLGKPIRGITRFHGNVDRGVVGLTCVCLERFGLNKKDFESLTWRDEPLEVFVNMEN